MKDKYFGITELAQLSLKEIVRLWCLTKNNGTKANIVSFIKMEGIEPEILLKVNNSIIESK